MKMHEGKNAVPNGAARWRRAIDVVAAASISVMVILVFGNAVLRYVLNKGYPPSEELARYFFVWTIFLGIIAAYKDGGHVSVTILTDTLKGGTKMAVQIVATALTIGTLVVLLYGGIIFTIKATTVRTVATNINFGLIAVSIVVMSTALLVLVIAKIIRNPPIGKQH